MPEEIESRARRWTREERRARAPRLGSFKVLAA
jgi:hypothetical protein